MTPTLLMFFRRGNYYTLTRLLAGKQTPIGLFKKQSNSKQMLVCHQQAELAHRFRLLDNLNTH